MIKTVRLIFPNGEARELEVSGKEPRQIADLCGDVSHVLLGYQTTIGSLNKLVELLSGLTSETLVIFVEPSGNGPVCRHTKEVH